MFIIMEIQVFEDGGISTPCYAYDDKNKADSKYHSILSSASVSKLPKHSAVMVTEEGYFIKSECYEHEKEGA